MGKLISASSDYQVHVHRCMLWQLAVNVYNPPHLETSIFASYYREQTMT